MQRAQGGEAARASQPGHAPFHPLGRRGWGPAAVGNITHGDYRDIEMSSLFDECTS